MPIGLTRLNERHQRPNQNITFIKVDTRNKDHDIALDILERVAAIVWPIMRDNHLGVMTLEDFPPNREFWGRNFNAGECIQLVLKSPFNGQWLPFQFICKVMLHEMAHIKHMNHSKWFHQVRIGYHKEFAVLAARGYTGDGFYGTGQSLSTGLTLEREVKDEELPENLCGGAYRKAKAKSGDRPKLTYAERQQKRKERLFGKGEGTSLGGDEKARQALEKGKGKNPKASATKPRVAQSQRGRDLRAQAALKRFEADAQSAKKEEEPSDDHEETDDSATEDETKVVQLGDGNRFVREDGGDDEEQEDWADIRKEMRQLKLDDMMAAKAKPATTLDRPFKRKVESLDERPNVKRMQPTAGPSRSPLRSPKKAAKVEDSDHQHDLPSLAADESPDATIAKCPACTCVNDSSNSLCTLCACVLNPQRTPHWRCQSAMCRGSAFVNSADAGICGCCAQRRPAQSS